MNFRVFYMVFLIVIFEKNKIVWFYTHVLDQIKVETSRYANLSKNLVLKIHLNFVLNTLKLLPLKLLN